MEHLESMDYLRSSVNLRAYGQREPIVEYKKDGLQMFREMEEIFKEQVLSLVQTIKVDGALKVELSEPRQAIVMSHVEPLEFKGNKYLSVDKEDVKDVGRNDPCPCGSGKKFKKCHGK